MGDAGPQFSSDIMRIILSRLPVKSLLRYKCVCKLWYGWITYDHYFMSMQLTNNGEKEDNFLLGLLRGLRRILYLIDDEALRQNKLKNIVPTCEKLQIATFVGSAKGLICLMDYSMHQGFHYSGDVYICNPAKREVITLPKGSPCDERRPAIGFGFGPKSKEYFVCLIFQKFQDNVPDPPICEMYSSTKGSWERKCSFTYKLDSDVYAFANNEFHWYITSENCANSILSIDIKGESRVRKLPERESTSTMSLQELKDSLSVLIVDGSSVKISILDHEKWTEKWKFSIELSQPFKINSLALQNNEVLFVIDHKKLRFYNLVHQRWRDFNYIIFGQHFRLHAYTESLFACTDPRA